MKRSAVLAVALALSACVVRPLSICTGADMRRTGYTATIAVADAWTGSGRPVPSEVMLARVGAVAALSLLNARCPLEVATPHHDLRRNGTTFDDASELRARVDEFAAVKRTSAASIRPSSLSRYSRITSDASRLTPSISTVW